MNPQQPYPPAQAPQPVQTPHDPSQYEFIMNNNPVKQPGKFNLPTGKSTFQRVLIFGGGIVALLVVFLIFMSLIGGGSSQSTNIISLAQDQTEIIRIADLAKSERSVRETSTKNLATNTSIALTTSKLKTLKLVSSKEAKGAKLGLKKSAKTDALLATAAANNQYDKVFTELLITKLKAYRNEVKTLFVSSKSNKQKTALKEAFDSVNVLIGEPTTN